MDSGPSNLGRGGATYYLYDMGRWGGIKRAETKRYRYGVLKKKAEDNSPEELHDRNA